MLPRATIPNHQKGKGLVSRCCPRKGESGLVNVALDNRGMLPAHPLIHLLHLVEYWRLYEELDAHEAALPQSGL
jgi:hypothetical protein